MENGGGAAAKEGVGIDWVTDTYHAQYQIDSESEKAVDAYRAVARAIYDVLGAKTLLDVGCGAGPLLRAYEEISPFGLIAGVEGSRHALREDLRIELHDLTAPLDLKWKGFDVVTCFDVAEHLPKEAAPTLVRSIVKHAGRWIVFGPAPEGQDGYYHINCQHPTWWVNLFEMNDVKLRAGLSETLRTRIREDERHSFCWWVAKNLMVFEKDTKCTMRLTT